MLRTTDKPHRLPGSAEAGFDFRTDGNPFHVAAENIGQERVMLVSAVVADAVAEQTSADTQTDRSGIQ